MIEATKGEKTKEIALDLTKARNCVVNEYDDKETTPKPVIDTTPRDWTEPQKPESQTMRVNRYANH